jgi:hypothetical protein
MHGDWLVDTPFATRVRNEIVAAGRAEPHHAEGARKRLGQFLPAGSRRRGEGNWIVSGVV